MVERDRAKADVIVNALQSSHTCEVFGVDDCSQRAPRLAAHDPDVVLIDADNPSRDMLEQFTQASRPF